MAERPFWETTPLASMTRAQWESLCDGCGRCCLHKLEDVETGEIHYTNVACRLLDEDTCRCRSYSRRRLLVPDCVVLRPSDCGRLRWLPASCAYRRLDEGRGLPDWHPLVTGDPDSVHQAGMSVRGRTVPEERVDEADLEDYVITWVPGTCRDGDEVGR